MPDDSEIDAELKVEAVETQPAGKDLADDPYGDYGSKGVTADVRSQFE